LPPPGNAPWIACFWVEEDVAAHAVGMRGRTPISESLRFPHAAELASSGFLVHLPGESEVAA
jgi:hypothetical protein